MTTVCKGLQSFLNLEDEEKSRNNNCEQLGIGSILCSSENKRINKTGSLRRTFSADMSSKQWLAQNQVLKKIASSEHLMNTEEEAKAETDIWSSIQSQRKPDSNFEKPNYIHPMVKKSKTALTKKSLEICSESLGSETGSLFSTNEETEQVQETEQEQETGESKVNCNYNLSRKSPTRSFPPPLPSISRACLQMKPVRHEGRLVLQAVHVQSQSYLHAQRQDGRLLLSFINPTTPDESKSDFSNTQMEKTQKMNVSIEPKLEKFETEQEEEYEETESEAEEEEEVKAIEQLPQLDSFGLVVNKIISKQFVNRNPWNQKLKMEQEQTKFTKDASFNVYDYYWRKPLQEHKKGEFPTRRCNETGKSRAILEHFCIATS